VTSGKRDCHVKEAELREALPTSILEQEEATGAAVLRTLEYLTRLLCAQESQYALFVLLVLIMCCLGSRYSFIHSLPATLSNEDTKVKNKTKPGMGAHTYNLNNQDWGSKRPKIICSPSYVDIRSRANTTRGLDFEHMIKQEHTREM
jgi:hypothetical protein